MPGVTERRLVSEAMSSWWVKVSNFMFYSFFEAGHSGQSISNQVRHSPYQSMNSSQLFKVSQCNVKVGVPELRAAGLSK